MREHTKKVKKEEMKKVDGQDKREGEEGDWEEDEQ
jgi:hypothetical protein